jgi:hypothetical protein
MTKVIGVFGKYEALIATVDAHVNGVKVAMGLLLQMGHHAAYNTVGFLGGSSNDRSQYSSKY